MSAPFPLFVSAAAVLVFAAAVSAAVAFVMFVGALNIGLIFQAAVQQRLDGVFAAAAYAGVQRYSFVRQRAFGSRAYSAAD